MNNFVFLVFSTYIDSDNESFTPSYRKMHVHPATVFASRRLTYRRPCHASIRQDKRASTERANANWKREVKVLRSRLVYGDLHRLRVLIRSFVQPSTRDVDVDVDIVESRSNVRRTTKVFVRRTSRTMTLADDCAENCYGLSKREVTVSLCMLMRLLIL